MKLFTHDEPHGVFFLIDNKSFYASCEAVARGLNPLKVPLVVLSEAENTNGGLILATSPEAKRLFHLKANVSRKRDLPNDPRLWVVPPRMNLYINVICRSIRSFINLLLKKRFGRIQLMKAFLI